MPQTSRNRGFRLGSLPVLLFVAGILGLSTAVGIAAALAARVQPSLVAGPETIRFPDQQQSGLVVGRRDQPGVIEITVQSGLILRSGGGYDATAGAVERLVPAAWRDRTVPWGWDGAWQPGMRRVRHLIAVGWPWPWAIAVLEAQGDSPDGPGGWNPVEGSLNGPGPTSPWDPTMPRVWPATCDTGSLLASGSVLGAGWTVLLATTVRGLKKWKRWRRLRLGRCPSCDYPFPPGEPGAGRCCPECGRTT
jgi:hypothetical protein